MPTRRMLELTVLSVLLLHPVLGVLKLWAAKTVGAGQAGPVTTEVAKTALIVT